MHETVIVCTDHSKVMWESTTVSLAPVKFRVLIDHPVRARITLSAALGTFLYETGPLLRTMFSTSDTGDCWFDDIYS